MKNMKVKEMTTLGILCAFAIVINLLAIFPLVPAVPWLTYDQGHYHCDWGIYLWSICFIYDECHLFNH